MFINATLLPIGYHPSDSGWRVVARLHRFACSCQASKFDFTILESYTYSDLLEPSSAVVQQFAQFVQSVTGASYIPILPNSKFLSLSNATYLPARTSFDLNTIARSVVYHDR